MAGDGFCLLDYSLCLIQNNSLKNDRVPVERITQNIVNMENIDISINYASDGGRSLIALLAPHIPSSMIDVVVSGIINLYAAKKESPETPVYFLGGALGSEQDRERVTELLLEAGISNVYEVGGSTC